MRKRTLTFGGIAAATALALALALWLHFGASPLNGSHPTATASFTPHHATMPTANLTLLQTALSSSDPTKEANALAPELRAAFLTQGQPMLPPGTSITLEPGTFLISSEGDTGAITAKTSGTSSGQTYLLHLVREDGTWYLLYTEGQ